MAGRGRSHPRFEPDAMIRADTVPDDEQPETGADGHKPSKTAWHGDHPDQGPANRLRVIQTRGGK